MAADRPLCVIIAALGGQGGGVLTDWLVEAARAAGYPAQATSIPGVAQRTGATTYYFELFPVNDPPADPIFSLFPSAGDVDIVAALEPAEAGRALAGGYITEHTTVITSAERIFSTAEKSVAGDGIVRAQPILNALEGAAAHTIRVRAAGASQLNAVLFGAIVGCGVLPLSEGDGRAAIEGRGLAVTANLAGYKAGLTIARDPDPQHKTEAKLVYDSAPDGFATGLQSFPETLRPLLGHALARLVDYDGLDYARLYLKRLRQIVATDTAQGGAARNYRLTHETARRLAAWMTYEDAIRVAQLKTRKGRLARIRAEVGAQPHEPVDVFDYLSPSRNETIGVLPAGLGKLLPDGIGRSVPLRWRTSSPLGYGVLKTMAALKPLRRRSLTYAHEQAAIEEWLQAVKAAAAVDYDLGRGVAELAVRARGYGDVRARGLACLRTTLSELKRQLGSDPPAAHNLVKAALDAARNDPDSICASV